MEWCDEVEKDLSWLCINNDKCRVILVCLSIFGYYMRVIEVRVW